MKDICREDDSDTIKNALEVFSYKGKQIRAVDSAMSQLDNMKFGDVMQRATSSVEDLKDLRKYSQHSLSGYGN